MQRETRKPLRASKAPLKQRADDAVIQVRARETGDPFATFTEWLSETDEKAYASL
jgi:hypothetical protein